MTPDERESPPEPDRDHPRDLEAIAVTHRYGNVLALDDVSVAVKAGCSLALVGESGSGKTTLLRCFNRMVQPDSGQIIVGESDVRSQVATSLRRRIGYVPQSGGLLPHWTVLRNVALVPQMLRLHDPAADAARALEIVGMPAHIFGARYPHDLSGGQGQRVALARALAARPGVILLDEPFGALDAITRSKLHDVFENARREFPVTMLLVTHDLAEAARLADDIVVMRAGQVEQRASFGDMRAAPATAYVASLVQRAIASAMWIART